MNDKPNAVKALARDEYVVGVLRDGETGERFYRVDASSTDDALQLAFAMDGAYVANDTPYTVQDEQVVR